MPAQRASNIAAAALVIAATASPASAQVWEVGNKMLGLAVPKEDARFGHGLAAGDFNGDGVVDLAVGAPGWGMPGAVSGGYLAVYLSSPLREFTLSYEWTSTGSSQMGWTLAAGDFDGDGRDELAIGIPGTEVDGADGAGEVKVIDLIVSSGSVATFSQDDTVWSTPEEGDRFGTSLAVGNFNGDAYEDLAVGSPFEDWQQSGITDENAGCVQVFYGSASGLSADGSDGFVAGSFGMSGARTTGDRMGAALATGDFNGDGFDDLAIGAPRRDVGGADDAGQVHVLYGSASGVDTTGQQLLSDASFPSSDTQPGDLFGYALAGYQYDETAAACAEHGCSSDLAIGVPGQMIDGYEKAGKVLVAYGSSSGIRTDNATYLSPSDVSSTPETDDRFGHTLAAGHSDAGRPQLKIGDLAIGTPWEDYYETDDGYVHIVFGASAGLDTGLREQFFGQWPGFAIAPPATLDLWGQTLVMADFDADGHGDLAVGVPNKEDGGVRNSGMVQILFGAVFADGFEIGGPWRWSDFQ